MSKNLKKRGFKFVGSTICYTWYWDKRAWSMITSSFAIDNCSDKDTFFRVNTRHGLVLEARSVSLALGTYTSMLKLNTSIYKGVALCAIYTPWLGFMILMKPLIFIVTSWVWSNATDKTVKPAVLPWFFYMLRWIPNKLQKCTHRCWNWPTTGTLNIMRVDPTLDTWLSKSIISIKPAKSWWISVSSSIVRHVMEEWHLYAHRIRFLSSFCNKVHHWSLRNHGYLWKIREVGKLDAGCSQKGEAIDWLSRLSGNIHRLG